MTPKIFVGWAAVSSEEQVKTRRETQTGVTEDEKISLQNQVRSNYENIKNAGGILLCSLVVDGDSRDIVLLEDAREIVDGYIETDGERRRCKPYAELHRLIKEKAFDVLIYYNSGRLGRDSALSMAITRLCHRAGIVTYATSSPPATLDKPSMSHRDYLVDAIGMVGYQEEIAEIKRRNAMGMVSRVERGDFAYRVPWPWVEKREGKKRWVEVDDHGRDALLLIVDLYVTHGRSLDAIAQELNAKGYKTPAGGTWYEARVKHAVSGIWRYAGYTWVNKKSLTGRPFVKTKLRWPAIISDEQAQAVEDEQHSRFFGRGSIHSTHRFSRCVYCAVCGRAMGAQYKGHYDKKSQRDYVYERYICPSNHPGKYLQAWRVDQAIEASIDRVVHAPDLSSLVPDIEDRTPQLQAHLEKLNSQLEKHRQGIDRIDEALADGIMDLSSYRRQAERIKANVKNTEEEIEAVTRSLLAEQRTSGHLERLQEIQASGPAMFVSPDILTANAWFRRLFRVWVEAGRVIGVNAGTLSPLAHTE